MYEAFITFFGNSMRVPYFLYEYLKNVSRFLGEFADVGYR